MGSFFRRLWYLATQARRERELAEEMEFHRSRGAAHFGNATLAREDARAVWIPPTVDSVAQDLRYAGRALRREPAFAALAVATLGVTIGLNTSAFTAFNAIMFRPWPVADPASMVTVADSTTRSGFSVAQADYFSERARSFSGFVATRCIDGLGDGCRADLDGRPATLHLVTTNYFDVLGVRLARGAGFSGAGLKHAAVAIVSDAAWKTRFGADSALVGRQIRIDDVPFTVVGIAPAGFTGTSVDRKDLWLPLNAVTLLRPNNPAIRERVDHPELAGISLAGRLAPGASREQARAELDVLNRQFRREWSQEDNGVLLMDTTFFNNPFKRRGVVPVFAFLFLGVALVLLLACANVGNLLLARAAARRREIAVRLSLGASRTRIVRQLLTESLVLALLAAVAGVGLAFELPELIVTRLGEPVSWHLQPDARVLWFTAALAAVTCLGFGLAPALHAVQTDITAAIKASGDHVEGAGIRMSLRSVLLGAQVAISVLLLVCAALLIRGVSRGYSTDELGFTVDGTSTIDFDLPGSYEPVRRSAFATALLTSSADLPAGIGMTNALPFGELQRDVNWMRFRLAAESERERKWAVAPAVTNGYFEVLGIRLVQGRAFLPGDAGSGAIVINESMARRFWPAGNAIGGTLVLQQEHRIVGIVRDVVFTTSFSPEPTIYRPVDALAVPRLVFSAADAAAAQAIVEQARRIDPRVRVTQRTLEAALDRRFSGSRTAAMVASILGILSVALASVGVFGVFRYVVQQRTREIGIRMALGARPGQVVAYVARSGSKPLIVGLAIGLSAAIAAGQVMRSGLHGLSPLDPLAFGGAAAILALAASAAVYLPSRRATRVEPVVALRSE